MNGELTGEGFQPNPRAAMKQQRLSPQFFLTATLTLNGSVLLLAHIAAFNFGWYVAEYLCTVGLVLQVVLVYRREVEIKWHWPWRFWSAFGLATLTYPFLTSVYVPSSMPLERANLLRTEQVIMAHYLIFLVALLPVLLICILTKSSNCKPSMASAS